ncbi:MAG: HNH endonuclease family protein [Ilumatobacteraceae bacterium]
MSGRPGTAAVRLAHLPLLAAVGLVALAGSACDVFDEPEPPDPARAEGAAVLIELIDLLAVEEEGPREGYSRDEFPHWHDIDGSGCTARQDALSVQALGLVQRDLVRPCVIVEGDWYSLFDGETHAGAPAEVDVDHVVALAEAWDSGAAEWSFERRRQFANDPLNLLVVTRRSNRDKADLDAGEWAPSRGDARCVVGSMMVLTKLRYDMTVDAAERDGLLELAGACDGSDQRTVGSVALPGTPEFLGTARAVLGERGIELPAD